MSVMVKICGLQTATEVEAAVNAGADAVGFVFAKSVRQVSAKDAAELSALVPAHVKRVAVMLHPSDDDLQTVLGEFMPDVLQTDAGDFDELNVPDNLECWPVFREGDEPASCASSYVYEGKKSGAGQTVDWSKASRIAETGQMILAGGLAAKNVGEAVATVRPFGVDVSSAVESSPGVKDPELIREFIAAVRVAEKQL